jgi:hypothetical protein
MWKNAGVPLGCYLYSLAKSSCTSPRSFAPTHVSDCARQWPKGRQAKDTRGTSYDSKGSVLAALVSTRYNPKFKAFHESLVKRGKPQKVALVEVMRKLLITLNAMIKNQKIWQDSAYQP